jgi:hypothetical protein
MKSPSALARTVALLSVVPAIYGFLLRIDVIDQQRNYAIVIFSFIGPTIFCFIHRSFVIIIFSFIYNISIFMYILYFKEIELKVDIILAAFAFISLGFWVAAFWSIWGLTSRNGEK